MDNMTYYNRFRAVPPEAQKQIGAGRLKGMTDINPMWRIQALTELFGPVGQGWYAMPVDKRVETGSDGQMVAIMDINLFYKLEDGSWSAPIFGTGGSMLVAQERNGLYTSDEAFKMAYTDALSVCCKQLGIGADVYWSAGASKYNQSEHPQAEQATICKGCGKPIGGIKFKNGTTRTPFELANDSLKKYGQPLCYTCSKKRAAEVAAAQASEQTDEMPPWENQQ